jgi:spore maturation protein SpmB
VAVPSVFVLIIPLLAVLELARRPNGCFALGVGITVPPLVLVALPGTVRAPVYEFAVIEALAYTVFFGSCAGWLVVQADQRLRDASDGAIVGKWTTVSGLTGTTAYLVTVYLGAYGDAIPRGLAAESPYTGPLLALFDVAVPLLLVGATWHPSRMVYFALDHYTAIDTARLVKWFPYVAVGGLLFAIVTTPPLEGYRVSLSVTADAVVLLLPACVSISAAVREYELYGLTHRAPIYRNRITDALYSGIARTSIAGTGAGLGLGLWITMVNMRFGTYASMGSVEFLARAIALLVVFRILGVVVSAGWARWGPGHLET